MSSKIRNLFAFAVAIIALTLASCSDEDFKMGSSFINSGTHAEFTNKIPIELSTFRLDSVLTSGQNKVWIGKVNKPVLGDFYSESYLKVSQPSSYGWAIKEKYDSITIVLRHTGEYEGDTMQNISIDVRRLATPLRFAENESSFYNVRSFRDSTSIGRFTVKPKPHSRPRLRYRLDDTFGRELVEFIKDSKSLSSDVVAKNFENMLGGIKLTFENDPKAMLAFRADSVKITLHSHMPLMDKVEIERTLTLVEAEKQFNHTWTENVDSPYDNLTERYKQVTEIEGGQHAMMFEGLGYYTRINFPSWTELQNINHDAHVVKATLKLYPERDSYDKRKFPDTFYLGLVNRGNVIQSAVVNSGQKRVRATLINNILDENQVYYTVDLTYFINTMLSKEYVDPKDGLVITWGEGFSPTVYDFMLFNGHYKSKYNSILEIYYYDYDKEDR